MPITRGWQRALDTDPGSDIAIRVRHDREAREAREAREREAQPVMDAVFHAGETIEQFTRDALAHARYGVTADVSAALAQLTDEARSCGAFTDGIQASDEIVDRLHAAYGKPLGAGADTKLGIALVGFWNRRLNEQDAHERTEEMAS